MGQLWETVCGTHVRDNMRIRSYEPPDFEGVLHCLDRSVREIAARYYNAEQVQAWAPRPADAQSWHARLSAGGLFVAESGGAVAAFIRVDRTGMVDLLYVHPDHARRGIATALMQRGERWGREQGLGTLSAHVSLAARAFFEAMGFGVVQAECVERRGVTLHNFRMTKKNITALD